MSDILERLNDEADLCKNDGADDIASLLWEAATTIATLRAEVGGLRADAERYRWLRKMLAGDAPMIRAAHELIDSEYVWQMDAAIDAAKADKEGA